MHSKACRVIILNYNGHALLKRCLPSIQTAIQKSSYSCVGTILDNGSSDESEAFVKSDYKDFAFVRSTANRFFCSYNEYIEKIQEPFVILLNNDIWVDENFIDPLLDCLDDHLKTFFATPKVLNTESGQYEGGVAKMEFRSGLPWGSSIFKGYESKSREAGFSMQCGFGAFRRDCFLKLKGYDDLYLPGTVEDTDLCFRGWRQGWTGYYCPESVVHHIGQASFKKAFGVKGIQRMNRRNLYLFVWKNIRSPFFLFQHIIFMPAHLLKALLRGELRYILALWDALLRLPMALKRRRESKKEISVVADKAIFEMSKAL